MYSFVLCGIINNSLKALLCFYVLTLFDMFTNSVYSGVIHAVRICLKHSSYYLVDALNKIVLLVKMYSYIRIPTHAHRCEHITLSYEQTHSSNSLSFLTLFFLRVSIAII
uniref:Uncharacterized protein n=1 Tax=Octopus bimaculoides TaxID=37653 RepID=A0A0L8GAA1_OCTBM